MTISEIFVDVRRVGANL